jgi:hypothetical protein
MSSKKITRISAGPSRKMKREGVENVGSPLLGSKVSFPTIKAVSKRPMSRQKLVD